jgi:serine/threonine-protein kinase HipA
VTTKKLIVTVNGRPAAELFKDKNGLAFTYASDWLALENRCPLSLSLPLRQEPYTGPEVCGWLQNLLPDSSLALQRIRGLLGIEDASPFDFLSVIGRDCAGAVQFRREKERGFPSSFQFSDLQPLTEPETEALLTRAADETLGMQKDSEFRFALAGAQVKTALTNIGGRWYLPLNGAPTTHILKLPLGVAEGNTLDLPHSAENEWLCLALARFFGFKVPDAEVLSFGKHRVLSVARFDRRISADGLEITRVHTEDFCQAYGLPPSKKYEADGGPGIVPVCALLDKSADPEADKTAFLAFQIFLWLIESTDAHAKNYSVFLEPEGKVRLTPFYDVLSVAPLVTSGVLSAKKIKLAMALSGKSRHYKISEIMPRHFIETAVKCGVSEEVMRNIFVRFVRLGDELETGFESMLPAGFPTDVSAPILESVRKKLRLIKACLSVAGK